jgi:imidazolonepropionase-like amidohydrolase
MRIILVMLALVILSALPLIKTQKDSGQRLLIINHVTLIDVTGNPLQPDMTLEIRGERISKISRSSQTQFPNGATVIDATGQFLIPGLWDMHVHLLQGKRFAQTSALLLASGVLGIRDMGSPPEEIDKLTEWRQQIQEGKLLAPRFVASGPMLDGSPPMFSHLSLSVKDGVAARQAVQDLQQHGVDFVKVYTLLSRDAYFAIADETRQQNLPFAGHVPDSVNALEASAAGQKSIEHLSGVMLACSADEDELRNRLLAARSKADPALLHDALVLLQTRGAETYSDTKAENLFAHFAKNETWQVPTLVGIWNKLPSRKEVDEAAKGFNFYQESTIFPPDVYGPGSCCLNNSAINPFTFEENKKAPEILAAMRRAGVNFLAGTDAPNIWAYPGVSLHQELALFVEAGFTPLEALQTATLNPAKYLGLLDSLGTLEAGKIADLVLLDANPLADIKNTRKVAAVIINGRFLDHAALREFRQLQ